MTTRVSHRIKPGQFGWVFCERRGDNAIDVAQKYPVIYLDNYLPVVRK